MSAGLVFVLHPQSFCSSLLLPGHFNLAPPPPPLSVGAWGSGVVYLRLCRKVCLGVCVCVRVCVCVCVCV